MNRYQVRENHLVCLLVCVDDGPIGLCVGKAKEIKGRM